jgi:hypothetical protein
MGKIRLADYIMVDIYPTLNIENDSLIRHMNKLLRTGWDESIVDNNMFTSRKQVLNDIDYCYNKVPDEILNLADMVCDLALDMIIMIHSYARITDDKFSIRLFDDNSETVRCIKKHHRILKLRDDKHPSLYIILLIKNCIK